MAKQEVEIQPFPVPVSAKLALWDPTDVGAPPLPTLAIEELSRDAVDDLAFDWLRALYASRHEYCPFHLETRAKAAEQ